MRKRTLFSSPIFFLLSIVFITSCQKQSSYDQSINTEIVSKVNTWLDSQKPANKPNKSASVEVLKQNLDFSSQKFEKYEEQQILIIPIKKDFKKLRMIDEKSTPVLVLILDRSGNIRKGNLVLYTPENGQTAAKIANNTFYHIFNTAEPECNGQFRFLSVTGRWLYQLEYKNKKLQSFGLIQSGAGSNNTIVNSNTAVNAIHCTDWYLITTYYYSDGSTSQTSEYIGRTCSGCDDGMNMGFCPDNEGGGSGGGGGENGQCNMTSQAAETLLNSITTTLVSGGGSSSGGETAPDANGIIRKPVVVHLDGVNNNYGLGYSERHELFFNGTLFKNNSTTPWKWESLTYSGIQRVSGSTPPCISSNVSASVSGPIISTSKADASYAAVVTTTITVSCLAGAKVGTNTANFNRTYYAASF